MAVNHCKYDAHKLLATKFFFDVLSELVQHQLHACLGVFTAVMPIHCQSHTMQY